MNSAVEDHAGEATVNGVDIDRLMQTVVAVKATPALARFSFRAQNRWIDGGHTRTTIKEVSGARRELDSRSEPYVAAADEPPVLLGEYQGTNPVEFVLHALAGCLTTTLVYHAAAQGIRIDEVESQLEGDIDLRGFFGLNESVRNGYENLCVTFRVKADAPEEKIRELCDLAQRRSPVFDIISNPVSISLRVEKG